MNTDYIKAESLKLFFEVARLKNFNSAARSLNMSPTLVSKKIIKLEKDLDMRLFNRTTRVVELTPVGEYLYLNLQKPLQEFEIYCNTAHKMFHESDRALIIGALNTADMNKFLFPHTNEYLAQNASKKIRIVSEYMSDLVYGVQNSTYDLAVVPDFLIHRAEANGLLWEYWEKGKSNVIIPRNNSLSHKCTVTLDDLKNEKFSFIGGAVVQDYANYINELFSPYNENIMLGKVYPNPYTIRDTFEQDKETIFFTDQYFTYPYMETHTRLTVEDHESGVIIIWKPENKPAEDFILWNDKNKHLFSYA